MFGSARGQDPLNGAVDATRTATSVCSSSSGMKVVNYQDEFLLIYIVPSAAFAFDKAQQLVVVKDLCVHLSDKSEVTQPSDNHGVYRGALRRDLISRRCAPRK